MGRSELSAAIYDSLDDLLVDETAGSLDSEPFKVLYLIRDGGELANQLSGADLDESDFAFLEQQAGLIITELPAGKHLVRFFTNEDKLDDRWDDMRADLADSESDGFASGEEEDEEEEDDDDSEEAED